MELDSVLLAFALTTFAGLCTGIGSIFTFFIEKQIQNCYIWYGCNGDKSSTASIMQKNNTVHLLILQFIS